MENLKLNNKALFEVLEINYPNLKIDPYLIGQGGMKTVLKGFDIEQDKEVVIKIITFSGTDSEKRTQREIDILKLLSSEYFPKIIDTRTLSIQDKDIFIIIESFIDGVTLRDYQRNVLNIEEAIRISKELLKALAKVHEKKLVHRDIKPENIMITNEKKLVLLDFGIARDLTEDSITSDLAIFGPMTIGYAAPEQIANKKRIISARTDLFSWAVVFYELIKNINPLILSDLSREQVLHRTLNFSPDTLNYSGIPDEIVYLIKKNLSPLVHRRSSSANEALEFLRKRGY